MKYFFCIWAFFLFGTAHAATDILDILYSADAPAVEVDKKDEFKMSGELGVLVAKGNTDGSTYTGKVNASQHTENWHNKYVANFLYKQNERLLEGEQERVTSAQKLFVSAQSDYKLRNPDNRLFIYGEYEDDRFNPYDYQLALAVGWSEQLWDDDNGELRYSIGPGYAISRFENQQDGEDQIGMILRASMEYEQKLTDKATFRQYLSTETDDEFSRSVSETSLAARINGALAMKVSLNMTHNRSPNYTGPSLDTETAVTFVYQFF